MQCEEVGVKKTTPSYTYSKASQQDQRKACHIFQEVFAYIPEAAYGARASGLTERRTSINSGILSGSPVHSSNIFSIPQALCWWLWQTQDVHIIVPLKSDLPAHNRILTSCSPFLCCFPLSRTTLVFLWWILLLHSALATSSSGGPCVIYWRWHGFMSHTALPGFPFIPILLPSIFFCASSEFDRIKFHMDKTFQKLCVSSDQSKYRRMYKP